MSLRQADTSDLARALASFKAFARALHPLTDAQLACLDEFASLRRYAAQEIISQPGAEPVHFGIVVTGLLVSTRTARDGTEIVRQIWPEGTLRTALRRSTAAAQKAVHSELPRHPARIPQPAAQGATLISWFVEGSSAYNAIVNPAST